MGNSDRILSIVLTYFVLGVSGGFAQSSQSSADQPPVLFVNAPGWHNVGASTDPTIVRTRAVRVNFDLLAPLVELRGDKLRLNLFDDASLVAVFERAEVRSPGDYTWFGHFGNGVQGFFILVVKPGIMAASIRVPGKGIYEVGFLGDGVHVIREIDTTKPATCGTTSIPNLHVNAFRAQTANPANCVDDGSQIDVLVVYTQAARVGAGGTANINAAIQLAIDLSNQAYVDSLVNTRLNLVHTAETVYDESNRSSDAIFLLQDPTDGVMDEVHDLRDEFRADLVSLVVQDLSIGGGFGELLVPVAPYEDFGFSVVRQGIVTSPFLVFTHELGHNMGCAHDRAGNNIGFFDYSFGYHFTGDSGQRWGTIMNLGGPIDAFLPNFSNPNVLHDGQPTGIQAGDPNSADNARTINETALIIANVRSSVAPDCNGNGFGDDQDIANGTSPDGNENGVPDECDITLFVDASAVPGGDGLSWATAYDDLSNALEDAAVLCNNISEIWVAAGTYTPDRGTGDRSLSFQLQNIPVYGGFVGNETSVAERAGLFDQTILSGDLNGDDGPGFTSNNENSYHVVSGHRTSETSVLDGFTVSGGNANGSSPDDRGGGIYSPFGSQTIRQCRFVANTASTFGGALFLTHSHASLTDCKLSGNTAGSEGGGALTSGRPRFINCRFSNNSADQGGGLYLGEADAALDNCVFSGNTSDFGAGLFIQLSESTVINSTISMNSAAGSGGGVYMLAGSTLTLRNSVLWNNTDTAGANSNDTAQILDDPRFSVNIVSVESSCVQDDDPDDGSLYPGADNIDDDPVFVDPHNHDLRLLPGSPCIDAGRNNEVPLDTSDLDGDGDTGEPIPFDLDLQPRAMDGDGDAEGPGVFVTVDMGAYEVLGPINRIPTISEWGLIVMTVLVLAGGTIVFGRREVIAHSRLRPALENR